MPKYHQKGNQRFSRRSNRSRQPAPVVIGADPRLKRVFAQIGQPPSTDFVPDPFQTKALTAISETDCLVTAPTGAGKTWIAQEAIDSCLKKGQKAWYACPLKALSNSKYIEFSRTFGQDSVGILTGDRKENSNASIIVGTTEILRNQLYDAMHQGQTLGVDLVILDEAHYMADPDRGVVWEEVMIYLPSRVALLMLSATIQNANRIAAWLGAIRQKECRVIKETHRPVPLYPLFLHPGGTLFPLLNETGKKGALQLDKKVVRYVTASKKRSSGHLGRRPFYDDILKVLDRYRLLPAIFFLKSRKDCDKALLRCAKGPMLPQERQRKLAVQIGMLLENSPMLSEHRQLYFLRKFGVAAHHGGQLPAWKLLVEKLMSRRLLKAVFATSTVAAGVNFPARTIAMVNSDRFNGTEFAPLTATEFHQMTGRAGRRGMDQIGFALILPDRHMDVRRVADLIDAPPGAIESQIRVNFSMVLNLLLSHSPDQIKELLARSFLAWQLDRRRKKVSGVDLLVRDFERHLNFLAQHGFAEPGGRPTADGRWAARLRMDQPLIVAEGLRIGSLPDKDPTLLAAVMGALVYDREPNDRLRFDPGSKAVGRAVTSFEKSLQPFMAAMEKKGFGVRAMQIRPAALIEAWAHGEEWEVACRRFAFAEGDAAALMVRTADHLRHIRQLKEEFPQIAQLAGEAIEKILKPPVVDPAEDYST